MESTGVEARSRASLSLTGTDGLERAVTGCNKWWTALTAGNFRHYETLGISYLDLNRHLGGVTR